MPFKEIESKRNISNHKGRKEVPVKHNLEILNTEVVLVGYDSRAQASVSEMERSIRNLALQLKSSNELYLPSSEVLPSAHSRTKSSRSTQIERRIPNRTLLQANFQRFQWNQAALRCKAETKVAHCGNHCSLKLSIAVASSFQSSSSRFNHLINTRSVRRSTN